MKFISSRAHGVLDYPVGFLLIIAPQLFGFSDVDAARNVSVAIGVSALVYSLLTSFELGLFKVIPFRVHLGLDLVSGVLLAASPWLFGFADETRAFHVTAGLLEVLAVLSTRPYTGRATTTADAAHPTTGTVAHR
jgi:hypothetical protein